MGNSRSWPSATAWEVACAAHASVDVPASQQMLLLGQSGGPCRCCPLPSPLLPAAIDAACTAFLFPRRTAAHHRHAPRHPSIHVSSNLQPELGSAPAGFPTGSRVGRGSVALVGRLAEMTEGSSSAPEALGKVRARCRELGLPRAAAAALPPQHCTAHYQGDHDSIACTASRLAHQRLPPPPAAARAWPCPKQTSSLPASLPSGRVPRRRADVPA